MPSKSFVVFPQITGVIGSDGASPRTLDAGLVLSHDSSAFQEGLQEIEYIKHMTKEFEQGLRRRLDSQSSSVIDSR